MFDIAFDPSGMLWGIGNGYNLYKINSNNGVSTSIGYLGGFANSLVSSSNGVLYAAGYSDFYVVNKTTGDAKFVGYTGFNSTGDLEFDAKENLYLMADYGDRLVRINRSNGSGTLIGDTGVLNLYALAFVDGKMFGVANNDVYTINTATGKVTLYDDNIGIQGSAYGASSPSVRFVWPVAPANFSKGHDGPCGDWSADPKGCYWLNNTSENMKLVWRDVQPFQRHEHKTATKYYGYHLGADYNLATGDSDLNMPVYPTATGMVMKVIPNYCGWGNIVFVKHNTYLGVYTSMYAHVNWLSSGKPKVGDKVSPMKSIARIGKGSWTKTSTCGSSGSYPAHLHFELRKGDNYAVGKGYSPTQVTVGLQGQINPNAFIASH